MNDEDIIRNIEFCLSQKDITENKIILTGSQWLQGLLDLYNKEKEKNGILQKELDSKIDALDMAMNNPDYISKDKIKEKIKELDTMIEKINRGELQKYTVSEIFTFQAIYEKLLEGK